MSSPIPSPSEQSPTPEGIQFNIVQPDLIYKAVADGQSGNLCRALLEEPAKSLDIDLESNGSTFDLDCRFDYAFDISNMSIQKDAIKRVKTELSAQGANIAERGGNLVFQGPKGTNLLLGEWSVGLHILRLSTGLSRDLAEEVRVAPPLEVSQENVENALSDITYVFGLLIQDSYQTANKPVPSQEISVAPPKRHKGRNLGKAALEDVGGLMGKIEIERPDVTFDEIGGQQEAKREIEGLAFALSNPDLYKKWGTKPPKGILLYGPPGTGKTLMAKALAAQADARFLHVKASDIGSKWYGESEQIVEQIFSFASENGKTIIYFDEIDSIAPPRDGKHEATQKVIGTLLQNIDGIGSSDNVMIVASTNRVQNIDEAMLRPGRLDRLVEVGLPDEEGREQILSIHQSKADKIAERNLFEGVDNSRLADKLDGYSGADIAEIIRRTLEDKVRLEGSGQEAGTVTTDDILSQINSYESVRVERSRRQTSTTGQYL